MTMTLPQRFAHRMLPAAVVVGLAVAAAPPLTYRVAAWNGLGEQAEVYASHVGQRLRAAVHQQPRLWRYNAGKIIRATMVHRNQRDIGTIAVMGCDGTVVLQSHTKGIGTGAVGGPSGEVNVVAFGAVHARVRVVIDTKRYRYTLWLIAALSIPLGLFTAIALFAYPVLVVRKQSRALVSMNRELADARDNLTERVRAGVEQVRRLSARVVDTQEAERRRIARDLHDGLGQALTGLQFELELAAKHSPSQPLDDGINTCRQALDELRRVVQEIRPRELESRELGEAMRRYAEGFEQRTGIATYFHGSDPIECSPEVATCLFRLLQEALTNVGRHARASEVAVRVRINTHNVSLEVRDDGIGFDVIGDHHGAGLQGMRERCEFFGGGLEVLSAAGDGTTISAVLPRGAA